MSRPGARRHGRLAAGAVSVALIGSACGVPDEPRWQRSDDVQPAAASPASAPSLVAVERGPIVEIEAVTAVVRSSDATIVFADSVGRIERRLVRVGADLAVGDVVLELGEAADPADDLRLDIIGKQIELADLEQRADDVERLQAELLETRQSIALAGASTVVNQVDGVLSRYLAGVFSTVRVGTPVYEVGSGDRLIASVEVDTPLAAGLAVGDTVSVADARQALADRVEATVETITPVGDGTTEVVIDVPPELETGIGDELDIELETVTAPTALRLPPDAVRRGPDGPFVVVADDPDGWRSVEVDTGAMTDDFIEITSPETGLTEGSLVVLP